MTRGVLGLSLSLLVGGVALGAQAQEAQAQEAQAQEAKVQTHLGPSRARVVVLGPEGVVETADQTPASRFGSVTDDAGRRVVILERLGLGPGYLGVQLVGLTDQLRLHFGVPEGLGALVSEVTDGSPAHAADLRVGDIITEIDAHPVRRTGDVGRLVAGREGEVLDLEVFRDGVWLRRTVTVGERQRPLVRVRRDGGEVEVEWIGGGEHAGLGSEDARFLFDDALRGLNVYFESDEWRERANGSAGSERERDGQEQLDPEQIELRIEAVKRQLGEIRERLDAIDQPPTR